MDKLFDTYKQIVDRAISLGLLSEESKSYYLSACGEEAASENTIQASNSCDTQVKHEQLEVTCDKAHSQSRVHSGELKHSLNPTVESNARNIQGENTAAHKDQIPVTSRSIENYSILDINNFIEMANSAGSDSEFSDILKAVRNISSGDSPAMKLNKVRKKPKKNEIVDFQIPIYLDIGRKKIGSKPSKVKKHVSLHEKGRVNIESHGLQNEGEKESHHEKIMTKRHINPQAYKSKHYSKIPKRINLTNNDKNTSHFRRCGSKIYEPEYKYKCMMQSFQGNSSPRIVEKTVRPSRVVSTPPMFPYSNSASDLESSLRSNKSLSNINKESVDYKERFPPTFQSFCDGRNKHGSKCTLFRSSNSRRFAFRSSPDVHESKNLIQPSKNGENPFFKYSKECKSFEKPESLSDDSSWKESTDSETKGQSSEKLLNLNIICQFFSSDSSGGKQDAASVESSSQSEKVEKEKITLIDSETQPSKEKCTRRSTAHFLSKLFSRTKQH
ncbi:hypothetical protein HNY73_001488 [Argiope bruennichi]|uniref:Uncharacterized protein n=1 Tax=Argiope bruennichi TaxID=94029 RepID=A0A8T0G1G0_ARGBR|nr:hypothetical protein HNY73_001488 [Argiope bruennichi]